MNQEKHTKLDDRCSTCHRHAHRPGRGGTHGHPYTPPMTALERLNANREMATRR